MSQTSDIALESANFSVRYPNGVVGCRSINMGVQTGKVTSIIGPSGCGKSTFLMGLNRLTDEFGCLYNGSVILKNGTDVMGLNQYELCLLRGEQVGYVMQKPVPFSGKTIFQDVSMPLRALGVRDKHIVRDKVKTALVKAALWDEVHDRLDNLSTSLSGGQQQRVCIARAIINMPDILLLDEPCSSLDPKSTQIIEGLVRELAKEHTIVLVTHNMFVTYPKRS